MRSPVQSWVPLQWAILDCWEASTLGGLFCFQYPRFVPAPAGATELSDNSVFDIYPKKIFNRIKRDLHCGEKTVSIPWKQAIIVWTRFPYLPFTFHTPLSMRNSGWTLTLRTSLRIIPQGGNFRSIRQINPPHGINKFIPWGGFIHTVRRFRHQSCRIYIFDRGSPAIPDE